MYKATNIYRIWTLELTIPGGSVTGKTDWYFGLGKYNTRICNKMAMMNEVFEGSILEYLKEEENALFDVFCRVYHI